MQTVSKTELVAKANSMLANNDDDYGWVVSRLDHDIADGLQVVGVEGDAVMTNISFDHGVTRVFSARTNNIHTFEMGEVRTATTLEWLRS